MKFLRDDITKTLFLMEDEETLYSAIYDLQEDYEEQGIKTTTHTEIEEDVEINVIERMF